MTERALFDLAQRAGLKVDWRDAAGEAKTVGAETLRRILAAMGLPCEAKADLAQSRARLDDRARQPAPLVTAEVGQPITLGPRAKPGQAIAEPGYHRLEIDGREVVVAVAPRRAFSMHDAAPGRRVWGLGVQVYGLRDARGEALGDFGAVARLARAAGRSGAQALAISPTHALFAADPARYSPYAPSTRLFLNGLYADPSALFADLWTSRPEATTAALIDWEPASRDRLARLRALHEAFGRTPQDQRRADFHAFVRAGGEDLERHALFEALHGHFLADSGLGDWRSWPEPFRDPKGPAVAAYAAEHASEVEFHLFLQWLAEHSLSAAQDTAKAAGMAIGLIADLAVGMDPGGSHAWSRPGDLLKGLSVGAPPDLLQPTGQSWGIAAFSPDGLRRSRFEGFLSTLRAAMRQAGGVRIDHAMGLRRLWVVPDGASAAEGAYLTYPFQDLMRLLALESLENRAVVVAEDLGTVPDGFREALGDRAMMGMRVLWFERTAKTNAFLAPKAWDASAAALTTTHDLPTAAGWWSGGDIDWAARLDRSHAPGGAAGERRARSQDRKALWTTAVKAGAAKGAAPPPDQPEAAVQAAIGLVAATPCPLAIVAIEDLLALPEQPNLPGTIDQHPNWRRRLPAPAETLFDDPAVAARVDSLNRARPA